MVHYNQGCLHIFDCSKPTCWQKIINYFDGWVRREKGRRNFAVFFFSPSPPPLPFFPIFFHSSSMSLVGNSGLLTWVVKAQPPQEQRYPFLPLCAVFPCVQTMVWLPVYGIFNVPTDVDTCNCTRGLYGYRKRVCIESCLSVKTP